MSGSTFGKIFRATTWGESHGPGLGVVIDGCPAGLPLAVSDIQTYLDRRKPGQSPFATARREADQVEILSGVFEGMTTGTPISLMVKNKDQRSRDYGDLADAYRPGHADYSFDAKYGFRDYRGGGRSSGRETLGRVAAGAIACKILKTLDIRIQAYSRSIGPVEIQTFDPSQILQNPFCMPDAQAADKAQGYLERCRKDQDSAGGVVECRIQGCPPGLGEPVFDKLDADLGKALLSIGAVKAVEIGDGMKAAYACGSQNNDGFSYGGDGILSKTSNHAGGILGGISDGSQILLRAYIKPTPSISQPQSTADKNGKNIDLEIKGRHDPVIVPRAVVVVEAMAALVLTDALLCGMGARMEYLERIWKK